MPLQGQKMVPFVRHLPCSSLPGDHSKWLSKMLLEAVWLMAVVCVQLYGAAVVIAVLSFHKDELGTRRQPTSFTSFIPSLQVMDKCMHGLPLSKGCIGTQYQAEAEGYFSPLFTPVTSLHMFQSSCYLRGELSVCWCQPEPGTQSDGASVLAAPGHKKHLFKLEGIQLLMVLWRKNCQALTGSERK